MKLVSVRIHEFRSIRDTNEFAINDITCLVGKNEAGKTAILQALYRLNPVVASDGKFDVTDDYPRRDVEDYKQDVESGKRSPAIVVKAAFELCTEEVEAVEKKLGKGSLLSNNIRLSKGYENKRLIGIDVNERAIVSHILYLFNDVRGDYSECETLAELSEVCSDELAKTKSDLEALATEEVKERRDQIEAEQKLLKSFKSKIAEFIDKEPWQHVWDILEPRLPVFLYFDEYHQMTGQVNIPQLITRVKAGKLEASDLPMLGFLELARINLEKIADISNTEALIQKLEGASNHLSKRILKYWSQNKHLKIRFDVRAANKGDPDGMKEGTNLWGRVWDEKHLVSTLMSKRSKGFVWFFSFLAWFDQQQKKHSNMVLLLDEPGVSLHADAQGDFLNFIEKELKDEDHQVVFTTHSPFMVDSTRLDRIRMVEDKGMDSEEELPLEEDGTKVFTDVLSASSSTLFPLQGALGYDIVQTLFIGPNNLVVEGVSDLLFLKAMSEILKEEGREGLDDRWVVTPVGGIDKVFTFVALLGSQRGLNLAVLIDFQKRDQQKIEELYKSKLIQKARIRTFAEFADQAEADIEDLFDEEFYFHLLNVEFGSDLKKITKAGVKSRHPRIVIRIEEYLTQNPLKQGCFSHYRPARYFFENLSKLKEKLSEGTKSKFELMFSSINKFLFSNQN